MAIAGSSAPSIALWFAYGRLHEGASINRGADVVETDPQRAVERLRAGERVNLWLHGLNLTTVRDAFPPWPDITIISNGLHMLIPAQGPGKRIIVEWFDGDKVIRWWSNNADILLTGIVVEWLRPVDYMVRWRVEDVKPSTADDATR